jgi:hypothetical protein
MPTYPLNSLIRESPAFVFLSSPMPHENLTLCVPVCLCPYWPAISAVRVQVHQCSPSSSRRHSQDGGAPRPGGLYQHHGREEDDESMPSLDQVRHCRRPFHIHGHILETGIITIVGFAAGAGNQKKLWDHMLCLRARFRLQCCSNPYARLIV